MKMWVVYFLIVNKKIVYIGMTGDIKSRKRHHAHKFDEIRVIKCLNKKSALKYEARWIKRFKPIRNTNHTKEPTTVIRVPVARLAEIYAAIHAK